MLSKVALQSLMCDILHMPSGVHYKINIKGIFKKQDPFFVMYKNIWYWHSIKIRIVYSDLYNKYASSAVQFNESSILGYCCSCTPGLRTVGCCSHITTLIWYLGFGRYQPKAIKCEGHAQKLLTEEKPKHWFHHSIIPGTVNVAAYSKWMCPHTDSDDIIII